MRFNEKMTMVPTVEYEESKEHIKFLISCLSNFTPFNGNLEQGYDITAYQTLSYEGDKNLLGKFYYIKNKYENLHKM